MAIWYATSRVDAYIYIYVLFMYETIISYANNQKWTYVYFRKLIHSIRSYEYTDTVVSKLGTSANSDPEEFLCGSQDFKV